MSTDAGKSLIDSPLRPIPRVVIAAFCERQETAAVMEVVFQDRRIRSAVSKLRMGGVVAAVDAYSEAPTPNLLIVEVLDSIDHARADLEKLAEVCDAGTRVMVLSGVNDVGFFKELVQRGVSEYLITPLEPINVISAIAGLFTEPGTESIGRVISVTGVRGGVGSSTIAHNIGWSLAEQWEQSVVVCELDYVYGTLALNFNRDPSQSIIEALRAPERIDNTFIDRMLVNYSERLRLLGGHYIVEERVDSISPEAVMRLIAVLREIVPYVVVDLPSGWDPIARSVLVDSENIVLVGEPDLASLRNMRNLNEILKNSRPHDIVPSLVLNKVDVPKRTEIPTSEFDSTIGADIDVVIPFDPESFGSAENFGEVIMAHAGDCEASIRIGHLTAKCYGNETVVPKRKKGIGEMIGGLFKK